MRISDWSSDVCSSDLWRAQTGTDPGTADGWNVTERAARITPVQPLTVHGPGRGHPALVAQGIEHRFPKPCVAGSNTAEGASEKNQVRSEERREGKECVSRWRARWLA